MGRGFVRTVLAGCVGGLLVLAAPALGHGVEHALFAHNADRVDGLHANAIVRTAGAARNTDAPVAGSVTIVSTQITAPRDGFLLIEATSDAYNFDTQGFPVCFLAVDEFAIDWSVRFLDHFFTVEDNCSTSAGGTVTKGTYTVSLQGQGDASTNWAATNLSAVFIPFGPNGELFDPGPTPLIGDDSMTIAQFRRFLQVREGVRTSKAGRAPAIRPSVDLRDGGPFAPMG